MKREITKERVILALAAPVLALVVAVALTSIILLATGKNPFEPYSLMVSYVSEWPDVQVLVINQAVTYYLAALAVAVGFRMNLFNIGVEGQYRLGACVGAIVGFNLPAPGVVKMIAVIVTAVVVGALWAGVAALLKVTRGVSEVIATIMLNSVAARHHRLPHPEGRLRATSPRAPTASTPVTCPSPHGSPAFRTATSRSSASWSSPSCSASATG